jgi:hypothetical protein
MQPGRTAPIAMRAQGDACPFASADLLRATQAARDRSAGKGCSTVLQGALPTKKHGRSRLGAHRLGAGAGVVSIALPSEHVAGRKRDVRQGA